MTKNVNMHSFTIERPKVARNCHLMFVIKDAMVFLLHIQPEISGVLKLSPCSVNKKSSSVYGEQNQCKCNLVDPSVIWTIDFYSARFLVFHV